MSKRRTAYEMALERESILVPTREGEKTVGVVRNDRGKVIEVWLSPHRHFRADGWVYERGDLASGELYWEQDAINEVIWREDHAALPPKAKVAPLAEGFRRARDLDHEPDFTPTTERDKLGFGVRQQAAIPVIAAARGHAVDPEDVGRAVHADAFARGKLGHPSDESCPECVLTGATVLVSLARRGVVRLDLSEVLGNGDPEERFARLFTAMFDLPNQAKVIRECARGLCAYAEPHEVFGE